MIKKLFFTSLIFICGTASASQIRTKTIEYAMQQSTDNVVGTVENGIRVYPNLTMYIPETTSRKFVSAIAYTALVDSCTVAVNESSFTIGVGIDSVAFSTKSVVDVITNTGENMSFIFITTFTDYFNTNFTGTSHVIKMTNQMSTYTVNANTKWIITYEYSDADQTRIKTVGIPIQSSTSAINTTQTPFGVGIATAPQIPRLDTFLPEASKVYRDIFLEIHSNEQITAAGTDPKLCIQYDNMQETCDASHMDDQASARMTYSIFKSTDISSVFTSTGHVINVRVTGSTLKYNGIGAVLKVTYEYDHSASTEVMNSLMVAAADEDGFSGGTTYVDKSQFQREFMIDETNPRIKQSGVLFSLSDNAGTVLPMWAGSQVAFTTYTFGSVVYCGGKSFVHRVDLRYGFSLVKGKNTFDLNWFRTGTASGVLGSNPSAVLYLNYVSEKSTMGGGDANHAHTVVTQLQPYVADAVYQDTISTAPVINEQNYWLHAANYWFLFTQPNATISVNLMAKVLTGELTSDGWQSFYTGTVQTGQELGPALVVSRSADSFKKHPLEPTTNMDIEGVRKYRFQAPGSTYFQGFMLTTYRSSTYTVTGTVSNYSGDGSGITVNLYRSDTNEEITTATTLTGGSYSTVWYDNTIPIYAVAREATGYIGRSNNGTAGTDTLDISLSCAACAGGTNTATINNATINNATIR